MSDATVTAVAYLRVSTAGQAERGMGLQAQRQAISEYSAQHHLDVEYVQEVASGGIQAGEVFAWEHRPVLLDLMEQAKAGGFSMLLVARFDRLARDHATLVAIERMLQQHGVGVISAAEGEGNGDSAVAEFVRAQLAAVAQLERGLIRERLKAGKAQRRRQGRHVDGKIPYGYQSSGVGTLEVDDTTASVVRSIFSRAREGLGPGPIARRLNAECIQGPTGKSWNRQTVTNILRNPLYAGELHGVKKAQPGIVSRRVWNEAQRG